MRLVVLGCAGSYPSAYAAASSYLVQADDAVLHAMTSSLTPASTRSSITSRACARTAASGLLP